MKTLLMTLMIGLMISSNAFSASVGEDTGTNAEECFKVVQGNGSTVAIKDGGQEGAEEAGSSVTQ